MFDYRSMFDLTGKTALVVGAGSGIGEASAQGLAAFGAEVYAADVNAEAAEATADGIMENGGKAIAIGLDMLDSKSVAAVAEGIGTPDVLVSTPSVNVRKPVLEITDEEFDRIVDLNLKGTFRLVRQFGRGMAERGSGSIIAFSSIRAQVVEPGQGVYAATKSGTVQMLRALAAELGPSGVRVNAIAPGVVETPLTAQIKDSPDWYGSYAEKSILGRWAQPHEMVGMVVYLASEAASYVTGGFMLVDGGWTAADGRFTPPL
ncbi:SDR family oxidoreductase [Rubrobacter tropicus]|uniref:SDR family oxidoreductase n=1 Tax=Rubrobacter tropicus TaxID=2653851 RepID=A0A6G8Q5S9_9ACTN|nr:SDR family oxidoreductase [Rubrobacter tropicus]QIN81844.1 SDR family oxidoreductase [Rubrobacter tropicus]